MISKWWEAHAFELLLDAIFFGVLLFGVLVIAVRFWLRERRKK